MIDGLENLLNRLKCKGLELDFSSVFFRGFVRFLRSYTCVITTWLRNEGNLGAGRMLVSYLPLALHKFSDAANHAAA